MIDAPLSPARRHTAGLGFCLVLATMVAFATPALAFDLNSFRHENALPAASPSSQLTRLAREHAADMARRNSLDHNGFDARSNRVAWATTAENVLYGCGYDTNCAFERWAMSPEHRSAMLLPVISHYGLASARGSDGRVYWALEMAGGQVSHRASHNRHSGHTRTAQR